MFQGFSQFGLTDQYFGQYIGLRNQIFINKACFIGKMDREILKKALIEHSLRKPKKDLIERDIFAKISHDTPFIVIVSGVRRCGKSTLLAQLRQQRDGYYVNFDDDRLIKFSVEDFQEMYELMIELFGEKDIFFFDEIQNIKGWERFVRRIHDEGKKIGWKDGTAAVWHIIWFNFFK